MKKKLPHLCSLISCDKRHSEKLTVNRRMTLNLEAKYNKIRIGYTSLL